MLDLSRLKAGSSPHIRSEDTTRQIMTDVIIALMPALVISVFVFGWRSLVLVGVSVAGCIFFEWLYQILLGKPVTISDCSAVITGILLAYCLPVSSPIWMVLVGDAFAIVVVKQLYGGIGKNFMNPALAARAFLAASYPLLMSTFTRIKLILPLFATPVDVITTATPLNELSNFNMPTESLADMALGMVGGTLGETSVIALLAGGVYLLYRRVITWHTPVAFLGTVALLTYCFPHGNDALPFMTAHLLSGGLVLGALFMATDYTSSPVTRKGQLIFGIGCGLFTVFIRYFGAYPEGVSYAILVMNACVFLIEKITAPKRFGSSKAHKGGEDK